MALKEKIYINYVRGKIYRLKRNGDFVEVGHNHKGYLRFGFEGKMIYNHRYIYEKYHNIKIQKEEEIDHINHIKNDNRIENLRIVNHSQNCQNIKKKDNCSSRFKGIYWNKECNKWRVRITLNKKQICLGLFNEELEAVKCYNNFVIDNNLTYIYLPEYQKNIL